jgi:hypothetical protein
MPITMAANSGVDFGERSCPKDMNCDARIRSWQTTIPALQYVLCYKLGFFIHSLYVLFTK